jgi:hypothetical protein
MSNLINSQPRFGLETDGAVVRIFDYATGVYHTVEDDETVIESVDGAWNAQAIAEAIKTQQQVFGAFLGDRDPDARADDIDETEVGMAAKLSRRRIEEHDSTVAGREHRDRVEQAKRDFLSDEGEQRTQTAVDETTAEVRAGAGGEQLTEEQRVQREEEEARKRQEEEQRRQQEAQQQSAEGAQA